MVHLDHGLIRRATSLITSANVHRATAAIFLYEQSVRLHNQGSPAHVVYQEEYEKDLRQFTEYEPQGSADLLVRVGTDTNDLEERNHAVMEYARLAIANARLVEDGCKDLDRHVARALVLGRGIEVRPSLGKRGGGRTKK
jgi:hypothetical protein